MRDMSDPSPIADHFRENWLKYSSGVATAIGGGTLWAARKLLGAGVDYFASLKKELEANTEATRLSTIRLESFEKTLVLVTKSVEGHTGELKDHEHRISVTEGERRARRKKESY